MQGIKRANLKKAKKKKLRVFYRQRLKDLRFRAFFAKAQDLRFREKQKDLVGKKSEKSVSSVGEKS